MLHPLSPASPEFSGSRMLTVRSFLFALLVVLTIEESPAADAPKIDRIVPAGMQRGSTAEIKISGKPGDTPLRAWTDRGELTFAFSEKNDSAQITAPEDAQTGIHWIRFFNDSGATDLRPFFIGTTPEVAEAEPNNDTMTAQTVEVSSMMINGVLSKTDDVDVFAVTLKAGTTFVASMQANRDLGSPMDAVLQLLGPDGSILVHNDDDHGFDPQIDFEVPKDGRYFVRTFAFPATPNSTIRLAGSADYIYRLLLTSDAFIDYPKPAVVDASTKNSIELQGWNVSDATKPLTVEIPPFEATSLNLQGDFANAAEVTAVTWTSLVESREQPQSLPIPVSVTGCISAADEKDQFTIDGKKGQKLTIEVASRAYHSLLDPVLQLIDPNGKELKQADDRSREDLDAETSITLKADGLHTIEVSDRYGHGGKRFFYVLTCSVTSPDFSASLKSNAYSFEKDKPLEIPLDISRSNGMAEVITVLADGLPEGVTAAPVESAKEGDTAKKVTLKLEKSPTAPAYSGPFSIVAKANDSGLQHPAQAAITKLSATTRHLWLTVPAPPEPAATESPGDKPEPDAPPSDK